MRDIGDARLLLKDAQEMTASPPVQASRRPVVLWSLLGALVLIAAALGAGLWRAARPADRPLMWLSVDVGRDARAARISPLPSHRMELASSFPSATPALPGWPYGR